MDLTEDVIRSYKTSAVIEDFGEKINSVCYSDDGSFLVCSSDDDRITLFDSIVGQVTLKLPSKRYGAEHVTYTHSIHGVLHASRRGGDDAVRYLNVKEYKYIRCFSGHTKKITGIIMSPLDDTFMTLSDDRTLKLWDLKQRDCVGSVEMPNRPIGTFDPEGVVFAIGYKDTLKFFDLRAYEKGPFCTSLVPRETSCDWAGMKISNNGAKLLIYTNASIIRVMDAFTGAPLLTLSGHLNNKGIPLEASFSTDSNYVFSGSVDGKVHCWNADTGSKVPFVSYEHPGPLQCIKMSPKYHSFATACTILVNAVRYLNVKEYKYIRCFSGHTKKITGIIMSPLDDTFMTLSDDRTLKLWDLKQRDCIGSVEMPNRPIGTFDPEGVVFAIGYKDTLKFFDLRAYEKGHLNNKGIPLEASFSTDSNYVFSGSVDGKVHCWNADTGSKVPFVSYEHPGPLQCIKMSPKYHSFATACTILCIWHPDLNSY
ncbi:unnamed protein product [Notodromas monacha]|uniref:WD repeat-containing protein 82 n=1 Tax=Notodromas monacha TaxID=399045 RepID=A0A7R9BNT9_9CRUS|nr:unnamed protein product [Notodromas monacha]CAG0917567.1 unnamed protein product [Notodromas monacha]